jgi:hypothetical protein
MLAASLNMVFFEVPSKTLPSKIYQKKQRANLGDINLT